MSAEDFYDLAIKHVLERVRRRILEAGAGDPNLQHRTERLIEDLRRKWLEQLAAQRSEAAGEHQRFRREGGEANRRLDQHDLISHVPQQAISGTDLFADTPSDRSEDEEQDLELLGVDADFAQAEEHDLLRDAMALSDRFGLRKEAVEAAAAWQPALPGAQDSVSDSAAAAPGITSAQQLAALRSSFAAPPKAPPSLLLQDGEPLDDERRGGADTGSGSGGRSHGREGDDEDDGIEEAGFFDNDDDEEEELETRKLDRLDQDQLVFSEDDDPEDRIPFCPVVIYCMQAGSNAVRKSKIEGEAAGGERWKVRLQNGIALVDGQELIFRSGRADFVW